MKGLVTKTTGSWYTVACENGQTIPCKIKGNFRLQMSKTTNPVVVGDRVTLELTPDGKTGLITSIEERKNYIIRKPSNLSRQYHILAANIDQALLVVTVAFPQTPFEFIDRFLVTAEAYRIPAFLVFNKKDLFTGPLRELLDEATEIYQKAGYGYFLTSVTKKDGIEPVAELLKNKITLISGLSGTGKSSLINAIEPGLHLKTGDISHYHLQGKHITTFYEMFPLSSGGYVIDSPGLRGFGLVDMKKEEIFHFFPEIFKIAANCQYYNCLHLNEPGCAVQKAVEEGTIPFSRYRSYINIVTEEDTKYRT